MKRAITEELLRGYVDNLDKYVLLSDIMMHRTQRERDDLSTRIQTFLRQLPDGLLSLASLARV